MDPSISPSRIYARTIHDLAEKGYGNLKYLDTFMKEHHDHESKCTVRNFSPSFKVEPFHISSQRKASRDMVGKCRSLYIVEDLSADVIEELGAAFDIEPQFFAEHLRDVEWEHHDNKSNAMMLPSVRHSARYWTLHYLEPIALGEYKPSKRTKLDMNVLRRIEFRTPYKDRIGGYKSIGLVHRVLSFWYKIYDGGFFEVIALVDPPLKNPLDFKWQILRKERWFFPPERCVHRWEPYGGGYVDFAPLREESAYPSWNHPHRAHGLRADLETRLERDCSVFPSHTDPVDFISLLLQKIILSNWMLTISFLERDFSSLHFDVLAKDSTNATKSRKTLDDLMSSRNLLSKCNRMARRSAYQLGINPTEDMYFSDWHLHGLSEHKLLQCDWTFLIQELKTFSGDTETLVANHIANSQIMDNKLAQDEAKAVNQLTALGLIVVLIFTPLGCAYGILSMGGDFAPGSRKFWIFPVIAIPLILLTVICFLLGRRFLSKSNRHSVSGSLVNLEAGYIGNGTGELDVRYHERPELYVRRKIH